MLTLTLVRHGATAFNAERRYQGHLDPALTPVGEAQARALAAVLGPDPSAGRTRGELAGRPRGGDAGRAPAPPAVYTSDLRRASRTAALALPGTCAVPDPRLRELDFGAFDGRSYGENLAAFGDAFRAWVADPARVRPPGGERLAELEARVLDWLDGLPREGHVIAFTHGGPIRAILAHLRRVPFAAVSHVPVTPGGAIRLGVPSYSVVRPQEAFGSGAGRPQEASVSTRAAATAPGARAFTGTGEAVPVNVNVPAPAPVQCPVSPSSTRGANHATPRPDPPRG